MHLNDVRLTGAGVRNAHVQGLGSGIALEQIVGFVSGSSLPKWMCSVLIIYYIMYYNISNVFEPNPGFRGGSCLRKMHVLGYVVQWCEESTKKVKTCRKFMNVMRCM